jgi:hypothetical protein
MYTKFRAQGIEPQTAIKNKQGGQSIPLKYNGTTSYMIQTPVLSVPFRISEYTPDAGPTKFSLELSFKGHEENHRIKTLMDLIADIDRHLIELAVNNSTAWFGKKMSKEVVEELYRPLIKPSKHPDKYAPTMKTKVRTRRNDESGVDVHAVTTENQPFDIMDISPGTTVKAIIDIAPIWFVNKQFGTTLTLLAAEIHDIPIRKMDMLTFQDEDEVLHSDSE